VAVIQKVSRKAGVRLFADNVIAYCVSNIRCCAFRRPLLENLRIAGMIIGVDEEDFGFLVLRVAVVDCLVVVAFYADAIGVMEFSKSVHPKLKMSGGCYFTLLAQLHVQTQQTNRTK